MMKAIVEPNGKLDEIIISPFFSEIKAGELRHIIRYH
jgi:hypothetical protein